MIFIRFSRPAFLSKEGYFRYVHTGRMGSDFRYAFMKLGGEPEYKIGPKELVEWVE